MTAVAPDGRAVLLLGPPGLTFDVTSEVLRHHGIGVVANGRDARGIDVIVLVEPASDHWERVRAGLAPVVMVAGHPIDPLAAVDAVMAGADAVLDASDDPRDVVTAVGVVATGGSLFGPGQARALANAVRRRTERPPTVVLTPREGDILECIEMGMSVKQTARTLSICSKTVENIQSRLFRKIGVRNRAQAIVRGHALGFIGGAG